MKIYLHPLEKERKKSDLEGEVIKEGGEELSGEEYVRRIREAVSEGKEYLRKGNSDKAAEKFDTASRLYNFLNVLGSEPGLKGILQEGAERKEGLEEKVMEGEQGEKSAETKKVKQAKRKPLVTLKVNTRVFRSKYWGLIPFLKVCKDNWYIQERKFIINFGQKFPFINRNTDTCYIGDMLERYNVDAVKIDEQGNIITDDFGNPIKASKRWEFKYNLATKIRFLKKGKERLNGGIENINELYRNKAKTLYIEAWGEDKQKGDWDRKGKIFENIGREDFSSRRWLKDRYIRKHKTGNGMLCLDVQTGEDTESIKIDEIKKPLGKRILNWGVLYSLLRKRFGREDSFYIDKDVVRSIWSGRNYSLNDNRIGGRLIARFDKRRIKTILWSIIPFLKSLIPGTSKDYVRPQYYIHIYDKKLANDEEMKMVLTMIAPCLDRERKQHKIRYKFLRRGKHSAYHPIRIASPEIDYSLLRPEALVEI